MKYSHDSLNVAVILAPIVIFLWLMCPISLKIWRIKINDEKFSARTVIANFWDKFCQQINLRSHSNTGVLCKLRKILSDLQWNWKIPIKKVNETF